MLSFQVDIIIRGKKAEKYQMLKNIYGWDLVDIYMMSGVLGFINNKKDIQDNDSKAVANLPRTVLNNRSSKIDFLCAVITLSEEIEADSDNAIKLAFEDNSISPPKKLYKQELFDDYATGGIDILYEMLSNIDYENQVDNIRAIIERFVGNNGIVNRTVEEILDEARL